MSLAVVVVEGALDVPAALDVETLVGEVPVTLTVSMGPRGPAGPAGPPGATDHGALTGLADDDHTQYLLVSGSRAMTGALAMGGQAITGVGNVDGRDVSADGATLDAHVAASNPHTGSLGVAHQGAGGAVHAVAVASGDAGFLSGADKAKLDGIASGATATPLASTTPAAVGSAAVGVGTTAARSDHVHAHGSQGGGTEHAAATTSVAGFMSAADKTKLDGVASGATALALSSTTPAAVGTAAVGVGTTAARADHVHAHGSLAGGTLHADVIAAGASGFMSGADKTKLDGVASGATATPLASTTPAAIGTAAVGVGTTAARADHVHAHGDQLGGALHATAIASGAAGFLSGSDKAKLDGIEALADVTDAANVSAAGAVMESDYTPAHSLLVQQSGTGSPAALAVANNTILGRLSGGGSDIAALTTSQVKTLLAILASEVSFAPNGDITSTLVQNAIVEVRDDTDTKLGAKVQVGGQLGGTITSPTVIGLRETSGPTLLTLGSVADGEYLRRVGSTVVGAAAGGGGSLYDTTSRLFYAP